MSLFLGADLPEAADDDGTAAIGAAAPPPGGLEFDHGPIAPEPPSALRGAAETPSILRASLNVPSAALTPAMRAELTLCPKTNDERAPPEPYPAFKDRDGVASVPRFWGLAVFGGAAASSGRREIRVAAGREARIAFRGTLRPYQHHAVDHVVAKLTDPAHPAPGAMLVAGCGTGKTTMSLCVASRLQRKTAVLVHNETLALQWVERAEQFTGTRPGIVQRERVEREADVLIVMIASLVSGRYDGAPWLEEVGLVIVDECHHLAARTFLEACRRFPARARLGLTATPQRRDGLERAVSWMLGPAAYSIRRRVQSGVEVRMLRHHAGPAHELKRYGKPDFVRMVTRAVEDEARTRAIVRVALRLVAEGRWIIVLSDRRAHLEAMAALLGDRLCGMYVGETSKKAKAKREGSLEKRVLLATSRLGEEGLDVPRLSSVLFTTPKSGLGAIEQAVGRILRKHEDKEGLAPVVVDVVDRAGMFAGMAAKRERYYHEQGYAVTRGALTAPLTESAAHSDEDVEDEEPLAALRARAEAVSAAAPGRVGGGA